MCNINKKTKRETATVYKVAIKIGKSYYAFFSGVRIRLGEVRKQTNGDYLRHDKRSSVAWRYNTWCNHYNPNMVGKSSGFATLKAAESLINERYIKAVVLKIVLGGEIWEGDAYGISHDVKNSEVVFAGTEILSFEEVK